MKSLLFTLTAFFVSVFGILALDKLFNGTLTGRGLAGSLAVVVLLTVRHCYRARLAEAECKREERLARRAGAHRLVELYRLRNERGEAEGDLTNWLLAVCVIAILLFLVTGRCTAAVCLWNPSTPEAVWQNQMQVDEHLKAFTLPPRATSYPLPKSKVVSAPIPSMAGLLACGLVGIIFIRRRGLTILVAGK
jgi:hypothetical protein